MKFEMGVHWKDFHFFVLVLSVCILYAASSNLQTCILNGLQFLDVGV